MRELPDLISSRGGNGMFSFSNCVFCTMISFICAAIREGTLSSLSKRGCFFPVPVLTSDGQKYGSQYPELEAMPTTNVKVF